MKFVHLHVHTHYSLLDGLAHPDQLLDRAAKFGYEAMAITDHGNLYGVVDFSRQAKKRNIKPIIGCEAYLAVRTRTDRDHQIDGRSFHLVLLAENATGYRNLVKLISAAHCDGFYYKPRIDLELLRQHHEGLIGLSACLNGKVARLLVQGQDQAARQAATEFSEIFGPGNFFIEVQHHPNIEDSNRVYPKLIALARELNLPLVATQDIHYCRQEDGELHDVFLAIQTGRKTTDSDRLTLKGDDFSLCSPEEMIERFADLPEAIENTIKIAERCNFELELGQTKLPPFHLPTGEVSLDDYLTKLARVGLKDRGFDENIQARERLSYELGVIARAGFASYFLIVQDLVAYARAQGIKVGPGRGSSAGSLVAYALRITDIDPLRYQLLFERFLNPDRINFPDIDMDFSDTRRDEILDYLKRTYGDERVAQIITFGKMAARAAVRDVGRALALPYTFCDQAAKLIPFNFTMAEALKHVPELRQLVDTNPEAKRLLDFASRLEGTVRHASVHASGVVITPTAVTDYVPVQPSPQDETKRITQYDMYAVEDLGLLKIDVLGLRTLSEIETAENLIRDRHGVTITYPEGDRKTFELLSRAETVAVFQLESRGMREYLLKLKPSAFDDIIAMVALYRPGPMELIPRFIARKHGRERVEYLHPKLEPILHSTYGIAVYQEQVMQIARDLGGFTMAEADVLRKAVGKKIASLLDEQQHKLLEGMMKQGIDRITAERIWSWVEPFARYGFNKSHAACYAAVSYQTAYLKTHYPIEFLVAVFTHEGQDLERAQELIAEAKRLGIRVLPPDLNESGVNYTIADKNTIRFGLGAIKNVGEKAVAELVQERERGGPFVSITDFLRRAPQRDLNRKILESLIKAGALDSLGDRAAPDGGEPRPNGRDQLFGNLDVLLDFHQKRRSSAAAGQTLFGASADELTLRPIPPLPLEEKLRWEKELLGIYVTGHPYQQVAERLNGKVKKITELRRLRELSRTRVGGVVQTAKRIMTKRNEAMMTIELEDLSDKLRIVFFPRSFEQVSSKLVEGKLIVVTGNYDPARGEMIGEEVMEVR